MLYLKYIVQNCNFSIIMIKKCQVLYYQQREKLNSLDFDDSERPYIFYWITRTSFNGLIRYNPKGKFNSPFHVAGRFGITPEELQSVFEAWGNVMDNIDTLEPYSMDTKYITNIPTKSGWHIITTPFNLQQFKEKYPNIDVHKNNPTLLYCL